MPATITIDFDDGTEASLTTADDVADFIVTMIEEKLGRKFNVRA